MAKVAIVMGSDSDMPIMKKAAEFLEEMGIDFEMTIISAHREPDIFFEWAKGAEDRGVKVIIAGAGKAAHLPGMCAALFPMPVIGIPMKTSDLGGVDSLYSIVQMPSGIPVATVAINGGQNAGILAAKILAASDPELLKKELDSAICRLSYLISRINLTNCETKINGKTLTELIAEKDALAVKISVYKEIAYAASQTAYRATHTEIKIKPAIVVADWQKEIDAMAKELRLLDNKLQESNWNTDLIE